MNGEYSLYSRIRHVSIFKARCEDLSSSSGLYPPLQGSKSTTRPNHYCCKSSEMANQINNVTNKSHTNPDAAAFPGEGQEKEEEVGEIFGKILSRSCSISCGGSLGLRTEKQISSPSSSSGGGLEISSAVLLKRAFSIKRSSSVSHQGYFRIHNHQTDFPADDHDGRKASSAPHSTKTNKNKGKIFKACRFLFGF